MTQPVKLRFRVVPGHFAIARTKNAAAALTHLQNARIGWIARDGAGWTAVLPWSEDSGDTSHRDGPWAALELVGPFSFTQTGVLAGVLAPLARHGIPILAASTFDTDHVLVPAGRLSDAIAALVQAGLEEAR